MRKLASIQKIKEILEHPNADRLEVAVVNGWKTVVKKDQFKVGDSVVYFEIDSWIPHDIAPFLTKPGHSPKEYLGVKGQRLKTQKIRGVISSGLILPLSILESV
jgi:RNA ligase (TIGR02306 family)